MLTMLLRLVLFSAMDLFTNDAVSLSPSTRVAFVGRTSPQQSSGGSLVSAPSHSAGCTCGSCRGATALFADVAPEEGAEEAEAALADAPAEVVAMDGVESPDEAHNVERPARQQLKKKKANPGKELSEFEEGSTVTGTVKSIASYGAFVDIGATTDGLLHISQLATGFVSDVGAVVKEGQEVQVRIVKIDTNKGQVALSLITAEEEASSAEAARQDRPRRQNAGGGGGGGNRRDDSAVLSSLQEKGWDTSLMVEGTVISTVDFGCFVRLDASALNSECQGSFDGLVHISAMRSGRVTSVSDIVKVDEKVQVRMKGIDGTKVALTMLSTEDEESKREERSNKGGDDGNYSNDGIKDIGMGAKDWKESVVKMDDEMPVFKNLAVVQDRRR